MHKLLEFNFLPIRYIHASWLNEFSGGRVINRLRFCKRVEYRLSQYILEQLGIRNSYAFDLPESVGRIALLDSLSLLTLVRYTGVSFHTDELRQCIGGGQVRAIKKTVGEDAYVFGLKRAPYLVQNLVLPKMDPAQGSLAERIWMSGMRCLGVVIAELQAALRQRVLLKLPSHWANEAMRVKTPNANSSAELLNKVFTEVTQT